MAPSPPPPLQDSPFLTEEEKLIEARRKRPFIKLGSTLEKEVTQIVVLWKYIKNLILNLKKDFDVSCRLLKVLAKDTFDHHTKELPEWLIEIMEKWYQELLPTLCEEE